MYNANLDRTLANRRPKQELRRDLEKWEDERPKRKKNVVEDVVAHEVMCRYPQSAPNTYSFG